MTVKTSGTVPMAFSTEVAKALAANRAVVALESTIITHGMPYPQNLETARAVEKTVRSAGATPATIAVIRGRLHIGLEDTELEALAQAKDVDKLSRADIAHCIARGGTGATTVAATMIAAHQVGIEVFATGGIGGVHKGADQSFDISADLHELAQTPVTVVCAGAKAILDLPKTFEVLETLGVPVFVVGQSTLPSFWSRDSGLPAPLQEHNPKKIALAARTRASLGLNGGQLVANPIPAEDEIASADLEPLIRQAQSEADAQGIAAKDVTPFLLDRLYYLSDGRTLVANIALVLNNALFAAKIARELTILPK